MSNISWIRETFLGHYRYFPLDPTEHKKYFWGREADIREIIKYLSKGYNLAVWGMPGIGKTTLVRFALHAFISHNFISHIYSGLEILNLRISREMGLMRSDKGKLTWENIQSLKLVNDVKHLIVVIDDFDNIAYLSSGEQEQILSEIRRLHYSARDAQRGVQFILISSSPLLRCANILHLYLDIDFSDILDMPIDSWKCFPVLPITSSPLPHLKRYIKTFKCRLEKIEKVFQYTPKYEQQFNKNNENKSGTEYSIHPAFFWALVEDVLRESETSCEDGLREGSEQGESENGDNKILAERVDKILARVVRDDVFLFDEISGRFPYAADVSYDEEDDIDCMYCCADKDRGKEFCAIYNHFRSAIYRNHFNYHINVASALYSTTVSLFGFSLYDIIWWLFILLSGVEFIRTLWVSSFLMYLGVPTMTFLFTFLWGRRFIWVRSCFGVHRVHALIFMVVSLCMYMIWFFIAFPYSTINYGFLSRAQHINSMYFSLSILSLYTVFSYIILKLVSQKKKMEMAVVGHIYWYTGYVLYFVHLMYIWYGLIVVVITRSLFGRWPLLQIVVLIIFALSLLKIHPHRKSSPLYSTPFAFRVKDVDILSIRYTVIGAMGVNFVLWLLMKSGIRILNTGMLIGSIIGFMFVSVSMFIFAEFLTYLDQQKRISFR